MWCLLGMHLTQWLLSEWVIPETWEHKFRSKEAYNPLSVSFCMFTSHLIRGLRQVSAGNVIIEFDYKPLSSGFIAIWQCNFHYCSNHIVLILIKFMKTINTFIRVLLARIHQGHATDINNHMVFGNNQVDSNEVYIEYIYIYITFNE